MALKPERSYPYLDTKIREIANRTADIIEARILQFANYFYKTKVKVERFTEVRWNLYADETPLFSVEIRDAIYIRDREIHLAVIFEDEYIHPDFRHDNDSLEKIFPFCKDLNKDTGLKVALLSNHSSFERYFQN